MTQRARSLIGRIELLFGFQLEVEHPWSVAWATTLQPRSLRSAFFLSTPAGSQVVAPTGSSTGNIDASARRRGVETLR